MQQTFHIHIQGIVQGVGFRPFVFREARKWDLKGTVNNTTDGVHILINAPENTARKFLDHLLANLPPLAVVTQYSLEPAPPQSFEDFEIVESTGNRPPDLLITPDVAMCPGCRRELYDPRDRRHQYPFITCTNCGPRYSIITALPYDRPNTTMAPFRMCPDCWEEYNNPLERRHFSQTNSCPACAVEMQWFQNGELTEHFTDLDKVISLWNDGKIVAVKGIGGYLLTCDATRAGAIALLRERKQRPSKPFALMYPHVEMLRNDVHLGKAEEERLRERHAPILLLEVRENPQTPLDLEGITGGLDTIGVMLPYTPLFDLLLTRFGKPIVATSGNISGSTVIHRDDIAVLELSRLADAILMNNRDITVPQDDGVEQMARHSDMPIVLRRSRGKAPVYLPAPVEARADIFAAGAMLKSVFGFTHNGNVYISQYLGNTAVFEAQQTYEQVFTHLTGLLQPRFEAVVSDMHPGYFSTEFAENLARERQIPRFQIQHHKAHLLSVLAENRLTGTGEPVLGIVWDGTGLGEDGNIWGGEFFAFQGDIENIIRLGHIGMFPYILGDKMALEPRISALALAFQSGVELEKLSGKFSTFEWNNYHKLLQKTALKTTSMGRLFDAVSSLLTVTDIHFYEAEASIRLENLARRYFRKDRHVEELSYLKDIPDHFASFLFARVFEDFFAGRPAEEIAARFHASLVHYIGLISQKYGYNHVAFSGGVFQNALLTGLIIQYFNRHFPGKKLFFHKELSPNDEGIALGQLIYGLEKLKQV